MVRIYYPSNTKNQATIAYYAPFIKSAKDFLKTIPGITPVQINQLDGIKSNSIEKAPVSEGKFPALIFNPGFGVQAQIYENTINELVSHGYIVVGINTLFINGEIALPNGHIVKPAMPIDRKEVNKKFLPLQMQDLSYVFKNIHTLHDSDAVFSAIDLNHIGAFGHSIGGKAMAEVVLQHPDWFQAVATLDIASYKDFEPIKNLLFHLCI